MSRPRGHPDGSRAHCTTLGLLMVSKLDNAATCESVTPDFWSRWVLIRESRLCHREKWALAVINMYAGDSGTCFPRMKTLQKDLSLKNSAALDLLRSLERSGVIHRTRRQHSSSCFAIDWSRLESLQRPANNEETFNSGVPEFRDSGVSIPESRVLNSGVPELTPYTEHSRNTHKNTAPLSSVPIPPELDCDSFREAWEQWLDYRKHERRKPVTKTAAERQLKKLAAVGVDRAITAINRSVENDWTGLFPDHPAQKGSGASPARIHSSESTSGGYHVEEL